MRSKKGYKTIVSIFAILVIIMTFIFFAVLFKMDKAKSEEDTAAAFQSIDAELMLKTFLQTPSDAEPTDLGLSIGETVTYMDLLSRSCSSSRLSQYQLFMIDATNFFEAQYPKSWKMLVIYYTPDEKYGITQAEISTNRLGSSTRDVAGFLNDNKEFMKEIESTCNDQVCKELALFKLNIRQRGMATQIIPCKEESTVIKLILLIDLKEKPTFDTHATTSYTS